jgi:hypothetical protein
MIILGQKRLPIHQCPLFEIQLRSIYYRHQRCSSKHSFVRCRRDTPRQIARRVIKASRNHEGRLRLLFCPSMKNWRCSSFCLFPSYLCPVAAPDLMIRFMEESPSDWPPGGPINIMLVFIGSDNGQSPAKRSSISPTKCPVISASLIYVDVGKVSSLRVMVLPPVNQPPTPQTSAVRDGLSNIQLDKHPAVRRNTVLAFSTLLWLGRY